MYYKFPRCTLLVVAVNVCVPHGLHTQVARSSGMEEHPRGHRMKMFRHRRRQTHHSNRTCLTCSMANSSDAPRVFIPGRHDGIGMRALGIMHGMAVAAFYRMNFGGVLKDKRNRCHGKNCEADLNVLFGTDYDELFVNGPPRIDFAFNTISDFNGLSAITLGTGANIFLGDRLLGNRCRGTGYIGLDTYFTPEFRKNLREQNHLEHWPVFYKPGRPSVAVHIRRGDITRDMEHVDGRRYMSDEAYLELIEIVQGELPTADVHVFSTTSENWGTEKFDMYREKNISVHLDGHILGDWAHMVQADVFILGKSSFSWTPAYFSRGCKIYADFCYEPLRDWIRAKPTKLIAPRLRSCLGIPAKKPDLQDAKFSSNSAAKREKGSSNESDTEAYSSAKNDTKSDTTNSTNNTKNYTTTGNKGDNE